MRLVLLCALALGCAGDTMALPESRNRTYGQGDPVVAADLNALQDEVVELHGRLGGTVEQDAEIDGDLTVTGDIFHGVRTLRIPAVAGQNIGWSIAPFGLASGGLGPPADDAAVAIVSLPLHVGDRIRAVRARIEDAASKRLTFDVAKYTDEDFTARLGTLQTSAGTGVQTLSVSGLTEVLAANSGYSARFEIADTGENDSAQRIFFVEVDYDRVAP